MKVFYFERLDVWQGARKFVKEIYIITKSFPEEEKFGIINQIRRASLSICANIAEGFKTVRKGQGKIYKSGFQFGY